MPCDIRFSGISRPMVCQTYGPGYGLQPGCLHKNNGNHENSGNHENDENDDFSDSRKHRRVELRHSLRGSLLRGGGYNNSLHVPLAVPTPAPHPLPPDPLFFLFNSTGPHPPTPLHLPLPRPPDRNTQANELATPGVNYPLVLVPDKRWISRNHGNHGNDENHGNSGGKPQVPQTMGLQMPDTSSHVPLQDLPL